LRDKGFVEDSSNPDFFISYEAGAADLTAEVEGFHATPAPRLNEPQGPVYGIPQNVWYSVDGHVTFQLVDAKSDRHGNEENPRPTQRRERYGKAGGTNRIQDV
jgi:hypothetical protein